MAYSPSIKLVLGSVAAIMALHIMAVFQEWYFMLWWIDVVLHVAGGAWVALVFFYVQSRYAPNVPGAVPVWLFVVLTAGVVMLVGVMWEWFEYGFDYFFVQDNFMWRAQLGLPDTMGDLLADLAGAAAALVYAGIRGKRRLFPERAI